MDEIGAAIAACGRMGCSNPADFPCSYVDRRRRTCDTHWCEQHALDINGRQY